MPPAPIFQDLVPLSIRLDAIFLDPNNPRFVGPNTRFVPDEEIDSEPAQENAKATLIKDWGVEKLRMNMEINGFLPMDRVVVRKFKDGKYVVLEGNRRICAAKQIGGLGTDGQPVDEAVLNSVKNIDCLEYVGTEADAAWIFQGLRHISGISEWSAYSKAKLLVEQMEREGLNLTEVGKRFGLTAFGAGQWVRGFYAFKQAREESDFIHEVDERSYPYFQELFSRSSAAVRDWMEWDEDESRFKNALNFNEFVGWLYPRLTDEEVSDARGDFEKRRIVGRDDLRLVASLIKESPKYFQQFRDGSPLVTVSAMATTEQYQHQLAASADRVKSVFDAISDCTRALNDIPYKIMKDDALKREFDVLVGALEEAITSLK